MPGSSWSRRDRQRASKLHSLSVVSQNVRNVTAGRDASTGRPTEDQSFSYAKRRIAAEQAYRHGNDVVMWQATQQLEDEEERYGRMTIYFHGCEPDGNKHGGVALMLSERANAAWIRSGRKEIKSGKVGKAARYFGMELHSIDGRQRVVKIFVVSLYMPQSGLPKKDYEDTLAKLEADIKATKSDSSMETIVGRSKRPRGAF